MAETTKTPRELLNRLLNSPLSDAACDRLHLAPGTTYMKALILGAVERALRGDNSAWTAIMNFSDPPAAFDDESEDEMSAALSEFFSEIAAKI